MTRAGFALRQKWALEAAAAKVCACGHRMGEHFELGYDSAIVFRDGVPEIVDTPRPGHRSGLFYCRHEGCTCSIEADS